MLREYIMSEAMHAQSIGICGEAPSDLPMFASKTLISLGSDFGEHSSSVKGLDEFLRAGAGEGAGMHSARDKGEADA